MRKLQRKILNCILIGTTALVTACSSANSQPPKYKPGGIVISYTADNDLNSYDNSPHSVMLAVYQLNNINGFHQLSKDIPGTQKLLAATKFDSTVVGVDTFFVNADESGVIKLDRLENAQWLGIVAGYYSLTAGQVVKEFQLPVSKVQKINLVLSSDSLQEDSTK